MPSSITQLQQENDLLQTELTELRSRYDMLQKSAAQTSRDPLLSTVAQVANLLLRSPDYTTVLPDVVRLLGEAVGSDRCIVTRNCIESSGQTAIQFLEAWFRTEDLEIGMVGSDPKSVLLITENWQNFHQQFVEGQTSNFIVADLQEPMQSFFASHAATSMLLVPILVQGQLWGQIGFDNCGAAKLYDEAEIAIVQVAADSIAAAIARQAQNEELLKLEQERSQELERLNTELQQTLDLLTESESNFRTLFEMSSEGFYLAKVEPPISLTLPIEEQCELFYQNVRVVDANPAFVAMYGEDSLEDVIGMGNPDCHTENSEKNRAFIRGMVESGYCCSNLETEEIDRHGRSRYFLNNCFGICKDGYFIGGWNTQTDITDLRLAQQALLQAEQERVAELEKVNEALKRSLTLLAEEPSLDKFLGYVLQAISDQLGDRSGAVYLIDEADNTSTLHLNYENGQLQQGNQITHPAATLSRSPQVWDIQYLPLLRQNQMLIHQASEFSAPAYAPYRQHNAKRGIQTLLFVPLLFGEQLLGSITIRSTQKRHYKPEELELARALAHQATLAIQLTSLAEENRQISIVQERSYMAREIHDTLAQGFAGILMQLQAANQLLTTKPIQAQTCLTRAKNLAQEGLVEARRSVWALRQDSTEYSNLQGILTQMAENLTAGSPTQLQIAIQGTPYPLKPEIGMHLFRIAQESLTNCLRHAQAQQIHLQLRYTTHQIKLTVQDDGCGFDPQQLTPGFGLSGMHQRADCIGANLQVSSQPGLGTKIQTIVPML